jgi:ABC-2 type transport system permease protein
MPAGEDHPVAGGCREWVKLRSLRSTVWMLAISVILMAGIGLLGCTSALLSLKSGHGMGRTHPAMLSLYGVYAGQLIYGLLGVLIVTREYATGMIRSTLTAVPAD